MMQPRLCEHEANVIRAARRKADIGAEPDAAVAAHLRTCAACRETFEVARYMTRLAADTDAIAATRALPEPSQLWWKARLLQRWDEASRATAPLEWMQRVEVIGGLVAVVVLLVLFLSDLRSVNSGHVGNVWANILPGLASVLAPGALSVYIAGALLLIGCVSLFTLRQLLVED
jgi:predicted anti-sigma-YlaC factor YlaD